jgi:ribosomal protein L16 Arg81 hydroxylase
MSLMSDSAQARFGLARLIDPIPQQEFEEEYLDRKPLYISRSDDAYYADLLTFDDLDRLLTLSGPAFDNIRVVSGSADTYFAGNDARRHEAANRLESIYRNYRAGSTLVLNSVNERFEPLKHLEHALHSELNAGFEMNVYLTPGGQEQGFKPHYDTHDVFVLQVYGTKKWQLYGRPFPMPLPMPAQEFHALGSSLDIPAEPERELVMQPGDLLYLPRGTVHAATSNDTATAHLTIGMHRPLWFPLIQDALFELAAKDARLRAALPAGFNRSPEALEQTVEQLRELLGSVLVGLRPERIVNGAAARTTFITSPNLRGHLTDLEQVGSVTADTVFYRREGMRFNLAVAGPLIQLEFHNKTVKLPVEIAPVVQFLATADEKGFTVADFPPGLAVNARLEIARTLLHEGFLTLSAPETLR